MLDEAASQLDEYFAGTRTTFDLPLDLRGTRVPARRLEGARRDPLRRDAHVRRAGRADRTARRPCRAVGAANGRNPLSIVLPCHRVVGSDGALRGFAGGLDAKAALLALERATPPTRTRGGLKPVTERTLLPLRLPGRARWGGSGSLNPKSAPAGPNAVRGAVSSGLGLRTRC